MCKYTSYIKKWIELRIPLTIWCVHWATEVVGTVSDCRLHLLRVVPKMWRTHNWWCPPKIATPWDRSFGINIRIDRRCANGKHVVFLCSPLLSLPMHDVFEWHCVHCQTSVTKSTINKNLYTSKIVICTIPDSFENHVRPCASTEQDRATYNRTFSMIVCRMVLKINHNNLLH